MGPGPSRLAHQVRMDRSRMRRPMLLLRVNHQYHSAPLPSPPRLHFPLANPRFPLRSLPSRQSHSAGSLLASRLLRQLRSPTGQAPDSHSPNPPKRLKPSHRKLQSHSGRPRLLNPPSRPLALVLHRRLQPSQSRMRIRLNPLDSRLGRLLPHLPQHQRRSPLANRRNRHLHPRRLLLVLRRTERAVVRRDRLEVHPLDLVDLGTVPKQMERQTPLEIPPPFLLLQVSPLVRPIPQRPRLAPLRPHRPMPLALLPRPHPTPSTLPLLLLLRPLGAASTFHSAPHHQYRQMEQGPRRHSALANNPVPRHRVTQTPRHCDSAQGRLRVQGQHRHSHLERVVGRPRARGASHSSLVG